MDCFARNDGRELRDLVIPALCAIAHWGGDPVRRGFSVQPLLPLEYWITHRSLSSGAHSRDPVAGDDD
jgi:hypothetical protein